MLERSQNVAPNRQEDFQKHKDFLAILKERFDSPLFGFTTSGAALEVPTWLLAAPRTPGCPALCGTDAPHHPLPPSGTKPCPGLTWKSSHGSVHGAIHSHGAGSFPATLISPPLSAPPALPWSLHLLLDGDQTLQLSRRAWQQFPGGQAQLPAPAGHTSTIPAAPTLPPIPCRALCPGRSWGIPGRWKC